MRIRKQRPFVGLVVLISMLLGMIIPAMVAAQNATPSADTPGAAQPSGGAASEPSEELVAAAADKTELIIGQAQDVSTLDPQMSTQSNDIYVSFNIFDNLITRDRDLQLQPMLATSWTSIDDTTWEFELREDVTFHD
ncbi:MAG: hypothetical protein M3R06_03325, partial [Chloroflexota bacterium]|nr:hypothetical protein [Chloroflexota bacterium]